MNIVVNPICKHLESFIQSLPSIFDQEGEIIYEGRNMLKVYEVNGIKLTVKSFKIPHLINQAAYSFFRKSKAERSYEFGMGILRKGINTPVPIAYIEQHCVGLLRRSYYISEYCDYDRSFREFDLRPGTFIKKKNVLLAFADFTVAMHEAGIYHEDYSNGNILFKEKDGNILFSVIDINRVTFGPVGLQKAYKAFRRLCAGEEMLCIIAERYAELRNFNTEECVRKMKYYNDRTMKPTPLEEWPPLEEERVAKI